MSRRSVRVLTLLLLLLWRISALLHAGLLRVFEYIDTKGDDKIDADELRAAMESLGYAPAQQLTVDLAAACLT